MLNGPGLNVFCVCVYIYNLFLFCFAPVQYVTALETKMLLANAVAGGIRGRGH